MSTSLVSIIIPTLNRAHLIGETLDSVLAQTYQNWECIVVDDGSTDNTEEVIAKYIAKDSRFQFHHRPKDRLPGGNAARNYGFEVSKGEYIQWFDSDDLMVPEKLAIKIRYALSENADIIIGAHSTEKVNLEIQNVNLEVFENSEFYIDYILGKRPVITNDVMVRRTIIGSLRFDENLHKAQEFEFFSRLFDQNLRFCFIDLALTFYRESYDSISKKIAEGNPLQVESLIYLSKLIRNRHKGNIDLVIRSERQGRKTYKGLMKQKDYRMVFKHYYFFQEVHRKSSVVFGAYFIYNAITGRGFDKIKPRNK